MESFSFQNQELKYVDFGDKNAETCFIWAHGWGHDHSAFIYVAKRLEPLGRHILLDFPGFGKSPAPKDVWGTHDYADFCAEFLKTLNHKNIIWVGHSFGCRVAVNICSKPEHKITKLVMVAGAGLKKKRGLYEKAVLKTKVRIYKTLKFLTKFGLSEDWMKSRFGSEDYRNADPIMRPIMVKTVNEDLQDIARQITCPTLLIYGEKDQHTPPEMGQRYNQYIPNSQLTILNGLDHYTLLTQGQHQLASLIKEFAT